MSNIWIPGIIECVASHMSSTDVACNLRLVGKDTEALLRGAHHTTIQLSHPVDPWIFSLKWAAPDATRLFPLAQRRQLILLTSVSGVAPNVAIAVAAAGCLPTREAWCAAAGAAQQDAISYLRLQDCIDGRQGGSSNEPLQVAVKYASPLAAAAYKGHGAMCEWLLVTGAPWCADAVFAAAHGGHGDLAVQLLEGHPLPVSNFMASGMLASFAHGCSLGALQQCLARTGLANGPGGPWRLPHDAKGRVLAAAAGSPTPDWRAKVEWLEAADLWEDYFAGSQFRNLPCALSTPWPVDALERIEWLRGRGYGVGEEAVRGAALNNDVAAVHYLLAAGVMPEGWVAVDAARAGFLEVLTELHAAGAPFVKAVVCHAAGAGHLHVVAWLAETVQLSLNGVMYWAAMSGSVELLAWLRARGIGWEEYTFRNATEAGSVEVLEWLVAEGCPMPPDGSPYKVAARNGDAATLACLGELGCPWGAHGHVFKDCVSSDSNPGGYPLPVLRLLLEAGCPVDWAGAMEAVERRCEADRESVREWLLSRQMVQG